MRLHRIRPLDPAERHFLALLRLDATPPAPVGGADAAFWERVLELAAAHRLSEFLYARRRASWWNECPDFAREALQRRYVETTLRNARFANELGRVLAALRTRGVVPVLLKGAALVAAVYPDPAERPFGDIDLLVRQDELDAACGVMSDLGYRLDVSFRSEEFYRTHHYHLIYRHAQQPWLCFEIHWNVALSQMDVRFDAEDLRRRALPVVVAGETTRVPEPADLLLHVALHGGMSAFTLLCQVRDVAALVQHEGQRIDAAALWRRATTSQVAAPLGAGLLLAQHFWPAAESARLLDADAGARRDALLRRLLRTETVLRQRLHYSTAGGMAAAVLRRDRWPKRRACLRRLMNPSAADLGLRGHAAPNGPLPPRHHGSRWPLAIPLRLAVFLLLTATGWEVEPKPD